MKLHLVRGFPGAGKSTFAGTLGIDVVEADQYLIDSNGVYKYDASKLADAHKWCQLRTFNLLKQNKDVAVANTFTRKWEMKVYYDMKDYIRGLTIIEHVIDSGLSAEELVKRSVHNVPLEQMIVMMNRWEK